MEVSEPKRQVYFWREDQRGKVVAEAFVEEIPEHVQKIVGARFHGMMLHRIWVSKRHLRQGYATSMMSEVVWMAKQMQWDLVLRVAPFGHGSASRGELVSFYMRWGFVALPGTRTPLYMTKDII